MNDMVTVLIGAAWLGILAVVAWGVVSGWRRQLADDGPLPLYRLLARSGVSAMQAEAALGIEDLARATRSCALCASRTTCDSGLTGGWLGERPAACPNAGLFERLGVAGRAP